MLRPWLTRLARPTLRNLAPISSARLPYRLYSTTKTIKPSLQLVAELRKRTEAPISKAREALAATNNDLGAALEWVQNDLAVSGAKKAEKVGGRETKEGLIGISLLGRGYGEGTGVTRAAMIELNCETDFVGRNKLFGKLVSDIAHSTAFHAEEALEFEENPMLLRSFPVDSLLDAPLVTKDPSSQSLSTPSSIGSAIRDTIAKVGENISLRRAISVTLSPSPATVQAGVRVVPYIHGGISDYSSGRMGTLAVAYLRSHRLKEVFKDEAFRNDLARLERALARQIVGFDTRFIRFVHSAPEMTLYEQPFILFPGEFAGLPVKSVLQAWAEQKGLINKSLQDVEYQGIAITEFARWSVGQDESSERGVSTLASEVEDAEPESTKST